MFNQTVKSYYLFAGLFLLGISIGWLSSSLWTTPDTQSTDRQPIYWVAPMDDNYRRDKPGLSPMGMDLVPVYADNNNDEAGVITVSPNIINSLGIRTSKAQHRPLKQTLKAPGMIHYDEDSIVHIHPRVEGWIETLHVKSAGETVKKGQAIYELYSPELVNAQQEYLAELNRNHKALIQAAEERLKALQVAPAFIKQLKKQRAVSQTVTFYAPQAGVINQLNIRQGFYVKPSSTLMSIASLKSVWIKAQFPESQAHLIKMGQTALVTPFNHSNKPFTGTINHIHPSLDVKTRTLTARLHFKNTEQTLIPNTLVEVSVLQNNQQTFLSVENEALIRTENTSRIVLALGQGQFKSVYVKTGKSNEHFTEITAGLSEGESVVTSAQFLLDSESSKQSDFKRISHPLDFPTATVSGVINTINLKTHSMNISRDAIKKWQRPAATLDFLVEKHITLHTLEKGQKIEFTFAIINGEFIIKHINTQADQNTMEHQKHD